MCSRNGKEESGRKDLISHITETGVADAGKATAAPPEIAIKPEPAPVETKHEKSIFDDK